MNIDIIELDTSLPLEFISFIAEKNTIKNYKTIEEYKEKNLRIPNLVIIYINSFEEKTKRHTYQLKSFFPDTQIILLTKNIDIKKTIQALNSGLSDIFLLCQESMIKLQEAIGLMDTLRKTKDEQKKIELEQKKIKKRSTVSAIIISIISTIIFLIVQNNL